MQTLTKTSSQQLVLGKRIVVIGTTGSGKTTLAKQIAQQFQIRHIELDAENWLENWTMRPTEEFRQRIEKITTAEYWVSDGNYSSVRDILWAKADTIIWLDYPIWTNFYRLFTRTMRRVFTREKLWGGNVESLRGQLSMKDSIFVWFFKTYGVNRKRYPKLLTSMEYKHLTAWRFQDPKVVDVWTDSWKK